MYIIFQRLLPVRQSSSHNKNETLMHIHVQKQRQPISSYYFPSVGGTRAHEYPMSALGGYAERDGCEAY